MTTLTINIEDEKDLLILKEILNRFRLDYKIDKNSDDLCKEDDALYVKLKKSLNEINDWELGKTKLQNAKEAIKSIKSELDNGI